MPELPEVELVARSLRGFLPGRRIRRAKLLRPRLAPHVGPRSFAAQLKGSRILAVGRRGKHILFDLDNGRTLLTHLRMSGRFMLLPEDADLPRFAHAEFVFDDGNKLIFEDQRHFGFMRVAMTENVAGLPEISRLAPEPFSEEFSAAYLHRRLASTSRCLKQSLLDQSLVCGLGNIYAAEVLFRSGIHPSKRANTISKPKAAVLYSSILTVLDDAIKGGSVLAGDEADSDSAFFGGEPENYWRVYGREGENCFRCGNVIRRILQGGRSTYYCPICQRR